MHCQRALLALSGKARKLVPPVAASPCFDTRPGQQGVQRHTGWLAAELVRCQSLHEDLHATTQVLAELAWKLHVATQVLAWLAGSLLCWNGGGALAGGSLAAAP